jgi:hypothetical protein
MFYISVAEPPPPRPEWLIVTAEGMLGNLLSRAYNRLVIKIIETISDRRLVNVGNCIRFEVFTAVTTTRWRLLGCYDVWLL